MLILSTVALRTLAYDFDGVLVIKSLTCNFIALIKFVFINTLLCISLSKCESVVVLDISLVELVHFLQSNLEYGDLKMTIIYLGGVPLFQ